MSLLDRQIQAQEEEEEEERVSFSLYLLVSCHALDPPQFFETAFPNCRPPLRAGSAGQLVVSGGLRSGESDEPEPSTPIARRRGALLLQDVLLVDRLLKCPASPVRPSGRAADDPVVRVVDHPLDVLPGHALVRHLEDRVVQVFDGPRPVVHATVPFSSCPEGAPVPRPPATSPCARTSDSASRTSPAPRTPRC